MGLRDPFGRVQRPVSELPSLGRRGFRHWSEVLADLRAIVDAPAPLNQARVWIYDPAVGGVAPTGVLAAEPAGDDLILSVDGAAVARLERSTFRGGWLTLSNGRYYLDLDIGQRHPIQVSGPGDLPSGAG